MVIGNAPRQRAGELCRPKTQSARQMKFFLKTKSYLFFFEY
jgi:hypothetical protein